MSRLLKAAAWNVMFIGASFFFYTIFYTIFTLMFACWGGGA